MDKIIVAGIGTDVGKTVVSTILTLLFQGTYWKPFECGGGDTQCVKEWIGEKHTLPPLYSFQTPCSPHQAAALENRIIEPSISFPEVQSPLIIESVGGVLVPLSPTFLTIDLFKTWPCTWIIVSKHYLGSINHTLLTIESLKQRQIPLFGIIFNGLPNRQSEEPILNITGLPCLGRLYPEPLLNKKTFQRYAKEWKNEINSISGIPLLST